jgi:nitroimidazol reductase NimA-like FMN-containing flavoprotein (pyridoxamine 5'-phosphate oxidase superfamily)
MIDDLTSDQIDQVLASHVVGRIGFYADGQTYIVPMAYAFDGKYIYGHSRVGFKISAIRKNPHVCFQVDIIENMANWRSVLVHGSFEELKTSALQLKVFKLLKDRLTPLVTSEAARPVQGLAGEKKLRPVFFRITLEKKTGRYEKK